MEIKTLSDIIEKFNKDKIKKEKKKSSNKKVAAKNITSIKKAEEQIAVLAGSGKDSDGGKNSGGYGTLSYSVAGTAYPSYTDYGKIFSYLGKFRSKSPYEDFEAPTAATNYILEQGGKFFLTEIEVIDQGVKVLKYVIPGQLASGFGAVPHSSMTSSEWTELKLLEIIENVIYNLKLRIG